MRNVQTNRFQENLFGHTFSKLYVNKHGLWMPNEGFKSNKSEMFGSKMEHKPVLTIINILDVHLAKISAHFVKVPQSWCQQTKVTPKNNP